MQKSILVEIISSLNKKEIREMNKWLRSPAHNQRQDVIDLFEHLTRHTDKLDNHFYKEAAWKAIYPQQPYDDAYMRQVMYFLLKSTEAYLAFKELSDDEVQFQLALMRTYRKRSLEKAYKQSHRSAVEWLENQPYRDKHYLFQQFLVKQNSSEQANMAQNASSNLQETSDALERWFLAEKMQIANAMLAHQRLYKTVNYEKGMLEDVMMYIDNRQLFTEPAIAAQYYSYKTITEPQEIQFFDSLEEFIHEKIAGYFTVDETRELYRTALNYCAIKANQGNLDYCRKALRFYRAGVEKGFLLENNQITRYTFGNAVGFAIRIGEFEWAEQFIERFQHHLDDKERNSIVNFNLSRVYFEKGLYDKAQDLLTQFEYDDMLFNIIAKTMLLKIYYEKDEFDAFESLLESMRTYLQRKEALDPARKASFKNMISLMKKLLHLNIYSRPQREKFHETVVKTSPLAEREWLLKQIE